MEFWFDFKIKKKKIFQIIDFYRKSGIFIRIQNDFSLIFPCEIKGYKKQKNKKYINFPLCIYATIPWYILHNDRV